MAEKGFWYYFGSALIVIAIPFFIYAVHGLLASVFRCEKCRSWKSKVRKELTTEWGDDVGDMLLMDPAVFEVTSRNCTSCGHVISSRGQFVGRGTAESFKVVNSAQ